MVFMESLWKRLESSYHKHKNSWSPALPSCLAGTIAFSGTLAASTFVQWKLFNISTGSIRPIPSLFGLATVALASIASHTAAIQVFAVHNGGNYDRLFRGRDMFSFNTHDWYNKVDLQHTLRVCTVGIILFKFLGGRFWAIAPSSFTNLGSFARPTFSLSATDAYASPAQRLIIERLGTRYGCHTCGSKMLFRSGIRFHADHMPPQTVADQMNQQLLRRIFRRTAKQRFYPQCTQCSNIQGGLLSRAKRELQKKTRILPFIRPNTVRTLEGAGGGQEAYFHGFRFRLSHFSGFALGAITTVGADSKDVLNPEGGSRRRFMDMQKQIVQLVRATIDTFGS